MGYLGGGVKGVCDWVCVHERYACALNHCMIT